MQEHDFVALAIYISCLYYLLFSESGERLDALMWAILMSLMVVMPFNYLIHKTTGDKQHVQQDCKLGM